MTITFRLAPKRLILAGAHLQGALCFVFRVEGIVCVWVGVGVLRGVGVTAGFESWVCECLSLCLHGSCVARAHTHALTHAHARSFIAGLDPEAGALKWFFSMACSTVTCSASINSVAVDGGYVYFGGSVSSGSVKFDATSDAPTSLPFGYLASGFVGRVNTRTGRLDWVIQAGDGSTFANVTAVAAVTTSQPELLVFVGTGSPTITNVLKPTVKVQSAACAPSGVGSYEAVVRANDGQVIRISCTSQATPVSGAALVATDKQM